MLACLILLIGFARWRVADEPADHDVATYAIIGKEILLGRRLYADVWDMKPPAIFATYAAAEFVAGYGPAMPWLLTVAAAAGTLLAVYFAALAIGSEAARWAALFFAAICLQPAFQASDPNTEAFIGLFLAAAAALALRDRQGKWKLLRWALIGVLFGIATLYKQVAIAPAACICLAHVSLPPIGRARKFACLESAIAISALAACWGLVAIYFAATGRLKLLYDTCITYSHYYAGSAAGNIGQGIGLTRLFPASSVELLPLLGLIACGIPLIATAAKRREAALLLSWSLGTAIAVALPGKFNAHYYQLWLAPLALAAGWSVQAWTHARFVRSPILPKAAASIALLGLLWMQLHWFTGDLQSRCSTKLGDLFMTSDNVGREIPTLLHPGETIFEWGDEPEIYWEAHQRPPTQGLWKMHMTEGPMADQLSTRTLKDLQQANPDLLALWSWGPEDHTPIRQWLGANYRELPGNDKHRLPMKLFVRIGSDLDRRMP